MQQGKAGFIYLFDLWIFRCCAIVIEMFTPKIGSTGGMDGGLDMSTYSLYRITELVHAIRAWDVESTGNIMMEVFLICVKQTTVVNLWLWASLKRAGYSQKPFNHDLCIVDYGATNQIVTDFTPSGSCH